MASYVADHIRVICRYSTHPWVSPCGPAIGCSNLILSNLSGLLRSTNSFPMNLSLHAQRKVTKRKGTPISLPFGFPHHPPLPTGRPDSPSGLDMTKSGDLPATSYLYGPTKGECFGKLRGENNHPVKLAENSFTGRVD